MQLVMSALTGGLPTRVGHLYIDQKDVRRLHLRYMPEDHCHTCQADLVGYQGYFLEGRDLSAVT